MPLGARIYSGIVISSGILVFGYGIYLWRFPNPAWFLCYLALAIPASCLQVDLPGVRIGAMSALFIFLIGAVARLSFPETLVTGVVCVAAQSMSRSRLGLKFAQVVFTIAAVTLAITATWFVYHALPLRSGPFRLMLAISVFFPVNTLLIATVIDLTEGKPAARVWARSYFWWFPYYLAATSIVSTFLFPDRMVDWQTAAMILPVVYVVYRSYRIYLRNIGAERDKAEAEREFACEAAALHEEALKAKAHLDAVFRVSPLGMVTLDRNCRVNGWSPGAEQLFGWNADEVTGKLLPFTNSHGEETLRSIVRRTLNGETIRGFETEQWRKDGSAFDASIWTATLPGADSEPDVLVTLADVSARKRLEEQLRLSQKMEAVGRLAGGVAHDFNNLLTVINGYGSLLRNELAGNPSAASYVDQIVAAGMRAAELVSQLLTFSRRQMIKPRPMEVNHLVREVERMLARVIAEHIELRMALDPEAGFIFADWNQLEGALLNLATNARDAMREGGVLTIGTARVEVSSRNRPPDVDVAPGSYVRLTVRDTGCGMDKATRQRLFEPFYTTKERGRGTGLGLASVLGAVEQNHGRISVASEIGAGSEFAIYLPRTGPVPLLPRADPAAPREMPRGTETILLVEDEACVRRLLRETLSMAGYRVREASNGAEAIHLWGPEIDHIDLVVTDLVMPAMNGLRLIDELRKLRPRLRAVCISGHSRDVISADSDLPANLDLLKKPLLPDVLVRKAREILDQHS